MYACITSSVPGEGLFEASCARYTVEIRCDGQLLATTEHRFSVFRALHADIAAVLQLPDFPARRRIFNFASVRREREVLLQKFLNSALCGNSEKIQKIEARSLGFQYFESLKS